MHFYCFYSFFVIFLKFFSEIFQNFTVSIERDRNFKLEKIRVCTGSAFWDLLKFMSFTTAEKMVRWISLKNKLELKEKYLLQKGQNFRNFTEVNVKKITLFCF